MILIFLFFFFILICSFLKYFIYVPKKIENKKIYIFIAILVFTLAVILLSVIAYIENNNVFEGLYNILCSIVKIKDHLINGDIFENGISWIGINKINKKIERATNEIFSFKKFQKAYISDINDKISFIDDLKNNISSLNETVTNPIPNGEKIPSLINDYMGNIFDNISLNGRLYYELDYFNNRIINKFQFFMKDTINSKLYYQNLFKEVQNIISFLNDSIKLYDLINTILNNEFFTIIVKVIKVFTIGRIILFFSSLILSMFGISIFLLYAYKDIKIFFKFS